MNGFFSDQKMSSIDPIFEGLNSETSQKSIYMNLAWVSRSEFELRHQFAQVPTIFKTTFIGIL